MEIYLIVHGLVLTVVIESLHLMDFFARFNGFVKFKVEIVDILHQNHVKECFHISKLNNSSRKAFKSFKFTTLSSW